MPPPPAVSALAGAPAVGGGDARDASEQLLSAPAPPASAAPPEPQGTGKRCRQQQQQQKQQHDQHHQAEGEQRSTAAAAAAAAPRPPDALLAVARLRLAQRLPRPEAARELAEIAASEAGLQLDERAWLVYPAVEAGDAGGGGALPVCVVCTDPTLPAGWFTSFAKVPDALRAMRRAGLPPPGAVGRPTYDPGTVRAAVAKVLRQEAGRDFEFAGDPAAPPPPPPKQGQQQPQPGTRAGGARADGEQPAAKRRRQSGGQAAAAAAAAASGSPALPPGAAADGRRPSGEMLALLQQRLSAELPGAQLDGSWAVLPRQAGSSIRRALDIAVSHPCVPGHLRSLVGAVAFLCDLHRRACAEGAAVPGLSRWRQRPQQPKQLPKRRVEELVLLALASAGSSFVPLPQRGLPQGRGRPAAAAGGAPVRTQQPPQGKRRARPAAAAAAGAQAGAGAAAWRHPPIDGELPLPPAGAILALGMFFASEDFAAETHAGMAAHRDRERLAELEGGGGGCPAYRAYSLDRDHLPQDAERGAGGGRHVQGNFNSARAARDVAASFAGVRFSAVFLDYFRIPTGYAADMFRVQLFTQFIPELVARGAAAPGVPVYLPNNPELLERLAAAGAFEAYRGAVALPGARHPLYLATERAQRAGRLAPGSYSNATEARLLPEGAEFVVLRFGEPPEEGEAGR